MSGIEVRPAQAADAPALLALHLAASAAPGGLARAVDEVEMGYVTSFLAKSVADGVALAAWSGDALVGEIHASRLGMRQFAHNLMDLTIAVHPDWQGQGIGARLFEALFAEAARMSPRIERIELLVREGHGHARRLYERMGFRIEGRFEGRVRLPDGTVEADLSMVKFV